MSSPHRDYDLLGADSARLRERLEQKSAVIGILGLGYVGLPLALAFFDAGFHVLGLDIDPRKIETLQAGQTYIRHIPDLRVAQMRDSGRFEASGDFSRVSELDAIIICVPTPLSAHREPDLSYVTSTVEQIAPHLRQGQIVILESTTYPFTSEGIMRDILERVSGLVANRDFAIAYSPEREDPGNGMFITRTTPKVVGADHPAVVDIAAALYGTIVDRIVPVNSMRVAEAVKLTENIFRAVNIALVNELKMIFERMGIDVWEVIDAAATKPFGFMPFRPGPGIGGHCIPIDPFYLTWKAREFGMSTRFIVELAGEINNHMPDYVVERTADALGRDLRKPLNGARVLVVGVAYKSNVDDMRHSPSAILMQRLRAKGAEVAYHDPFVPQIPELRDHADLVGMESIPWDSDSLKAFDAAIIATDHSGTDYAPLLDSVPLVVDTRNALRDIGGTFPARIVKA